MIRLLGKALAVMLMIGLAIATGCSSTSGDSGGSVPDPGAMGSYAVYKSKVSVTGYTSSASLYAPSLDDGKTRITNLKRPLVVVLPGFGASYTMYEHFILHMVSWGYVVLGMNFENDNDHTHNAMQVQKSIDWALSADSGFADIIDETKIATAGHSKGGKIAIYAATGDSNTTYPQINFPGDPRIKLIIGWDPIDAGGPPCPIAGGTDPQTQGEPGNCFGYAIIPQNTGNTNARMLLFDGRTGNPDGFTCQPAGHTASTLFNGARHAELIHYPEAGHTSWMVGPLATLGEFVCGAIKVDSTAVIALAKRTNVAFLQKYFDGLPSDAYLTGSPIMESCKNAQAICSVKIK